MSLESGQTLAQYRLTEKIGEGGMGVVWKARDTNLDRDVAIKLLPPDVALRPERLQRFESEARTTGGLNHPNIVGIFDLGKHGDAPYIVMELVEGETLRDKVQGAVPFSQTTSGSSGTSGSGETATVSGAGVALPPRKVIEYVTQIAHGLAAAHDRGVVHRDLKPENIFITPSGQAKILDFGLAKLVAQESDVDSVTRTAGAGVTAPGAVLGTVGYMAPEQVRGREVDHRADIFALGVILYELLSGRRAFQGDSAVETLNAILTMEPPALSSEHTQLSPILDRIIHRCMEKEPAERFQSGDDLAFALQTIGEATSTELSRIDVDDRRGSKSRNLVIGVVGAVALAAVAFFAGRGMGPGGGAGGFSATTPVLTKLTYDVGLESQPTVSPDGRSLAYVARSDNGTRDIFLRRVGGETSINLTNSADSREFTPMFSPDGERIAFWSSRDGGGVFMMGATGESVRRLTDFGYNPSWSPDGAHVLVSTELMLNPLGRGTRAQLWRIDVASGEKTLLSKEGDDVVQPRYSPNGKRIAYWGLPEGTGQRVLYTMPAEGGDGVPIAEHEAIDWNPVWSPDGRWLYFLSDRGGTMNVWRVGINESNGEARGEPEPLTVSAGNMSWMDVAVTSGRVVFSTMSTLTTLERLPVGPTGAVSGEPETLLETSMGIGYESLSPDGRWLAFTGLTSQEDLYLLDLREGSIVRLTTDEFNDRGPNWMPDSERLLFFSDRTGRYQIWSIRPDGSGLEQITETAEGSINQPEVSPDGKTALVMEQSTAALLDLTAPRPVRSVERLPEFGDGLRLVRTSWSPDGRRIMGTAGRTGERGGRGVWIHDLENGEFQQQFERNPVVSWLTDSRLAVRIPGDGIVAVDLDSDESTTLYKDAPPNWLFSADRSWLYTSTMDSEEDIWMLDSE